MKNISKERGEIINSRWEIGDKFSGETGQGYTYKVKYLKNENTLTYVIKLLKRIVEKDIARFRQEIEASVSLNHSNIISVVDYKYEDTDEPYLVTELCSGGELKTSKIGKLTLLEKLRLFESICDAIAFAHENKVIHRDIKPSNIFLDNQRDKNPIVGDFGLCFFNTDETNERLTETLEQVGAKSFRPPEAEYGIIDEMNPSFDVYSLGKLLYWFLSNGKSPVREDTTHPSFDLRKNNTDQAIHFAYGIFDKSICEKPEDRYESAVEMLENVKNLMRFTENDARYLDCNIPQQCIFCLSGKYEFEKSPKNIPEYGAVSRNYYHKSEFFGYKTPEHDSSFNNSFPVILIARCNRCGNIQQFRLDKEFNNFDNWKNIPETK